MLKNPINSKHTSQLSTTFTLSIKLMQMNDSQHAVVGNMKGSALHWTQYHPSLGIVYY